MIAQIIIVFLFTFSKLLPSNDIWSKLLDSIKNKTIIIPENGTHFIYDEKNYLKEDINSAKMQILYKMQNDIFNVRNVPNYIFFVENIDESKQDLAKVAENLLYSVSNKFKVNSTKTIVGLFSMTSHRIRIQPGINILNKFKKIQQ